jgi:hypothetical protein
MTACCQYTRLGAKAQNTAAAEIEQIFTPFLCLFFITKKSVQDE